MYFLLSSMSMVYVLTTPIPKDGGDNSTVEQIRKRAKWDNNDYVCKGFNLLIFSKLLNLEKNYGIPWRPNIWLRMHQVRISLFTQHKMNMDEAIQGSYLRIEESLRAQDSDKPKGNNVVGLHYLRDLNAIPSLGNKKYFVTFIDDASRTDRGGLSQGFWDEAMVVVRLPDPKLKTMGERGIECIFVGYAKHSKAFRFSSVPRPSLRIPNGTEDIGSSVVLEEVTEEVEWNLIYEEVPKAKGWSFRALNKILILPYAIGDKLSWYTSNPGTQHLQAIQWVLKYLKKTMDYRLTYTGYPSVLEGYTDASKASSNHCMDNSSIKGWIPSWQLIRSSMVKNLLLKIPLWVKPIAPISIRYDSASTLAKAYKPDVQWEV
ncbi:hypothetical protein Tco_1109212 [Tanacetum coccineum]